MTSPPSRQPAGSRLAALFLGIASVAALLLLGACSEGVQPPVRQTASTTPFGTVGGTTPPSLPLNTDDVPTMKVAAAEDGERFRFDAPDVVPSGPLAIELTNTGKQPHDVTIMRPKPNITRAQLNELLTGPAPEAATTIAQLFGGSAPVAPQGHQTFAVRLDPGDYFLVSMHRGLDGRLGVSHGMLRRMTVVAPSETFARKAKAPHEGAGVTITDDAIKLPDGFGLSGWFKVTDTGQIPHELVIVKVNDGAKPDDVKAWLTAVETGSPPNDAPFTYVGGSAPLDPNRSDAIQLDLGKGTFVAYCTLPDRQNGFTPSYAKGVYLSFTRA